MNINNVVLVGKYKCIDKIKDECSIVYILINDEEGEIIIPIYINNLIAEQIKDKCNTESLIGVKGRIYIKSNKICIIAVKISLLLLNTNN